MKNQYNNTKGQLGSLLTIILILTFSHMSGQFGSYSISGPSSANVGYSYYYQVTGSNISSVSWGTSPNGTIISSNSSYANIRFNSPSSGTIDATIQDTYYQYYYAYKTVSVSVGVPGNPTITRNDCGTATLQRNGTPPTGVTWYWQGKNSSGTSTTSGSGSTYTANQGSGTYYIRARTSSGSWSTSSGSVYVSVSNFEPGVIGTVQPICYNGDPITIPNTTSPSGGNGYSYAWQYSNNGSSGWTTISGATSSTYNPPGGLTASRWYRRVVISCGQNKYTNSIKITVYPDLVAGEISGVPPICYGGDPSTLGNSISPTGGNNSYTYAWQFSNNGSSGWTTISGATSSSYNPPGGLTASRWYRRVVISCGQNKYSNNIKVTVNPALIAGGISGNQSICSGEGLNTIASTSLATGGNGTYAYQWQSSSDNISWNNITGATSATYSPTEIIGTTWYRRGVTSCGTLYTTPVQITVEQATTWYADFDGDGFGDPATALSSCSQPTGYVLDNSDACPGEQGSNNGCDHSIAVPSDENYVYTRTYQKSMTTDSEISKNKDIIEQIAYFDGLGRPMQQIAIKGSPDRKDIVTHVGYDGYGRMEMEWLPYNEVNGALGSYRTGTAISVEDYYKVNYANDINVTDPNPFSQKEFEASPLNRVLKQAAPGHDWRLGGGKEIEFGYEVNSADEVLLMEVTTVLGNNTYVPTLVHGNGTVYYTPGRLYKTVTKDENHPGTATKNHTTEEFKDKSGRVVLKRTYGDSDVDGNGIISSNEMEIPHDTYYVYDDYGNLTYVIPPKVDTGNGVDATELSELCYQYVYDQRNRLVEKNIPGKGWEYIVYNKLDQPIMTQDPNLAYKDKWLFTKYDALGRVAYTGIVNNTDNRITLQSAADSFAIQYEEKSTSQGILDNTVIYYSNNAYPNTGIDDLFTINYYDNYTFDRPGLSLPVTVLGQATTLEVKGLATGTKVRVLETDDWITTMFGYDEKGRSIWTKGTNDYLDTTDLVETELDFAGKVLQNKSVHQRTGYTDIITIDSYAYDHMGRPTVHTQNLEGTVNTISSNEYDPLGQLISKSVGGTAKDEPLYLTDMVNVSLNGTTVTNTAATGSWDNGFASANFIEGDGYVEWEAVDTNTAIMVGLSSDNPNANFSTIEYAIYTRYDGSLRVYKDGVTLGTYGNYSVGDKLRLERRGNILEYKHNGIVVHSLTLPSIVPLQVDASMFQVGSSIANLRFNGDGPRPAATPLQTVDYKYNVRGWLKGINDTGNMGGDLFAFGINYNTPSHGGTGLFNGNISETEWRTANTDSSLKWYRYGYDALNRITSGIDNTGNYNLSNVSYDQNGNIMTLSRYGWQNGSPYPNMDVLDYDYDTGNKLVRVADAGNDSYGFIDGTNTGNDYDYDQNGNMTMDLNKGIQTDGITYNHLNLPTNVVVSGYQPGTISYIYDAMGTKLEKSLGTTTTHYAGNYIYENGTLQFFSQPEGYVTPNGSGGYDYVYQYKDHLGNVRLSYTDADGNGQINDSGIFNDGFESANGWNTGGTITDYDSSFKMSGEYSGKIVKTTAGEMFVQSDIWTTIDNANATDYTFSGWVYSDGPTADIFLFMKTETEAGYFTQVSSVRSTTTGQWEYMEKTVSVPSDIKKLNIRIDNNGGGTVWFDDIQIEVTGSEIVEENNYYPFGLEHKGYNNQINGVENNYMTFQGQEHEKELGKETYAFQWRDYDPAIGRFNKVDRFAEKYFDQSPYHFTKNNPITFQEVKGDSIRVSFRTGFLGIFGKKVTLTYDAANKHWNGADGKQYSGETSKFADMVLGDLNKNRENVLGNEIVSNLANDNFDHFVKNGDPNKNTYRSGKDNRLVPKDLNIYYNGDYSTSEKVLQGGKSGNTPGYAVLGHEMAHKYSLKGVANVNWFGSGSNERGVDEYNAMYYENVLRGSNGLPLRTHYTENNGNYQGAILNSSGTLQPPPTLLSNQNASTMPEVHAILIINRFLNRF